MSRPSSMKQSTLYCTREEGGHYGSWRLDCCRWHSHQSAGRHRRLVAKTFVYATISTTAPERLFWGCFRLHNPLQNLRPLTQPFLKQR